MTFIALNRCVSAKERKAILVILYLLDRSIPSADGMALRAVRTELSAMDISVAVGASLADVGENRFDVALGAAHFLVHAAERVGGLVVIELHVGADRPPAISAVAIFTGNIQRAVRAARAFSLPVSGQCE